jgi:Na+/H+ antiporter NhaA
MGCAILAMVCANSGLSVVYATILHTKVSLHIGELQLSYTIHHWLNDGLMAGKFIGVFGLSWLIVKLGIVRLPQGLRMSHIGGVGLLAGIGFTMAIFIGELAFVGQGDLLVNAGSLLPVYWVIPGYVWAAVEHPHRKDRGSLL